MYVCNECGHLFEESAHAVERHGLDAPPYEEYDACPACFGWSFQEAQACTCCGEYITGDFFETADGNQYCENCVIERSLSD